MMYTKVSESDFVYVLSRCLFYLTLQFNYAILDSSKIIASSRDYSRRYNTICQKNVEFLVATATTNPARKRVTSQFSDSLPKRKTENDGQEISPEGTGLHQIEVLFTLNILKKVMYQEWRFTRILMGTVTSFLVKGHCFYQKLCQKYSLGYHRI
ncbi:uncharacterized protein LOC126335862 [Schistocerca gregaria]|uniref:uncharacterized protein LOC126335862 n=1 Tax=Schistocerca gregaria TaxID=7010 RepID=UPI00211EFE52|nr:uncharacterized protein LOC126335862 [Schistocerca gregaria]